MFKVLLTYGSILLISTHFVPPSLSHNCIHSSVSHKDVPVGQLSYNQMRGKRDKHAAMFQPLTIHSYIDDIDSSMPENAIFNINNALKKVTTYFRNAMLVRRSFNPFLLERLNCAQRWNSGVNKDKCSRIKSGPEFCSVKLTEYIIPDKYLNKLEVFDESNKKPHRVIKSGRGVKDANFILFVISRTTSWCQDSDVLAYGSFCRLDKENRPVAGLLNLCPNKFSKTQYRASHYYNVIMHEVIHTLGFSLHLFPKYRICITDFECVSPKKLVEEDVNGVQRIVLPEVIKSTQKHFNCSEEEFGAPLAQSEGNDISSHWHPLLMYTSIMTPTLLEDYYVVIDNITLALLSSTGWYKVDFRRAGNFVFGKGEGCKFGYSDTCETTQHLCDPSKNITSCDLLQYTIGQCETIVPYHSCGVFKPNKKESCVDEEGKIHALNSQSLQHELRCVMLQSGSNTAEPTCVAMKCKTPKTVEVNINSTWIECEENEKVEAGNITLSCPTDMSFCTSKQGDVEQPSCSRDSNLTLSVRMYFTDPKFEDLLENQNFKKFKVSTVQAIAERLDIPVNYIVNATLVVFKTIFLDFAICPPSTMNNDELSNLLKNVQTFLKSTSFTHILKGFDETPIASTKISLDPEVTVAFSDHEGFRMLSMIPVICAIFVVATFIASIIRYANIQKHRPKRETEAVEMEETNQILNESENG